MFTIYTETGEITCVPLHILGTTMSGGRWCGRIFFRNSCS